MAIFNASIDDDIANCDPCHLPEIFVSNADLFFKNTNRSMYTLKIINRQTYPFTATKNVNVPKLWTFSRLRIIGNA